MQEKKPIRPGVFFSRMMSHKKPDEHLTYSMFECALDEGLLPVSRNPLARQSWHFIRRDADAIEKFLRERMKWVPETILLFMASFDLTPTCQRHRVA